MLVSKGPWGEMRPRDSCRGLPSFVVSYGINLVHDFLFAEHRLCWSAVDEAVEHLLASLGLLAKLTNKFTEQ